MTNTVDLTIEERVDLMEGELNRHQQVIEKLDRLVYKLFKHLKQSKPTHPRSQRGSAEKADQS